MSKFKTGDIVEVKKHFAKVISITDTGITCLTKYHKSAKEAEADVINGLQLNEQALSFVGAKKVKAKAKTEDAPVDEVTTEPEAENQKADAEVEEVKPEAKAKGKKKATK